MKNDLKILCGIGVIWLCILLALICGIRINPKVEGFVLSAGVGWFTYITLTALLQHKDKPKNETDDKKK